MERAERDGRSTMENTTVMAMDIMGMVIHQPLKKSMNLKRKKSVSINCPQDWPQNLEEMLINTKTLSPSTLIRDSGELLKTIALKMVLNSKEEKTKLATQKKENK